MARKNINTFLSDGVTDLFLTVYTTHHGVTLSIVFPLDVFFSLIGLSKTHARIITIATIIMTLIDDINTYVGTLC